MAKGRMMTHMSLTRALLRVLTFVLITVAAAATVHAAPMPKPAEPEAPRPTVNDEYTTPIALNLNNADIQGVLKFISDNTGKPVLKDKSVQAQLTISAPAKIQPYEALDLIYDALRLQGFSVVETNELIQIVPAADTAKYPIETFSGELPSLVARQKSRLIRMTIELRNVRASQMKEYLQPLLGAYASITADERTNKLIILDTVRNIDRYKEILAQLDTPGFEDMEVRIVQLQHADAAALQQVLQETVVKAAGAPQQPNQKDPAPTVVMADARTNSLVIAAQRERMDGILEVVAKLDVAKEKAVTVHVVPLKYADAEAIASAVSPLFRGKSQLSEDNVEIRATGRDNSLLILSSEENYKLIMEIVRSIDTEEAQQRETRRFELKHLDAEDTATQMRSLYGEMQNNRRSYYYFGSYGGRGNNEDVNFVPITRTNTLVVIAPPTEFKLIESLIQEIDQPVEIEEALPRIYRIHYAKASDVEETLNTIFGEKEEDNSNPFIWWSDSSEEDKPLVGRLAGKIRFTSDENTNSIIAISNNQANYDVVDRMIEQLDVSIPELANTMIVPLRFADSQKLSNVLNSLFGKPTRPQQRQGNQNAQGEDQQAEEEQADFTYWWGEDRRNEDEKPISNLIEQVRFVADPRTNSILVTTAAQNFEIIRNLIMDLDREEPQVMVKVKIMEVSRDRDNRVGLRWTPDNTIYSPEDMDNAIRAANNLTFTDTFDNGRAVLSSEVNLDLLLQLLIKSMKAEIVHSPTLYISNNEKGKLFVGKNIPRLKDSQTTSDGSKNDSFENEDIGITMEITPKISKNGQVVLQVSLVTAQQTGETRFGSDVLQKREYNTRVAVQDGETMVIGGIRMTTDQKVTRKFPILGQIPIIGYLFSNTQDVKNVTDLYAFITPEVISTTDEAREATKEVEKDIEETRKPKGILPPLF